MTSRKRLPPGARWVSLPNGEKRVELVMDVGIDPATGKRRQTRRRLRTVEDAINAYAEIRTQAVAGTFVVRTPVTVEDAVRQWLASRHGLRASTLAGYHDVLKPVVAAYGSLGLRQLTKAHVVELATQLTAGGMPRTDGKRRKPWKPRTINLLLFTLGQVLDDAVKQGLLARNVAALVDRLPQQRRVMLTFTEAEVIEVLRAAENDSLEHAWHLALYGLRRGEVAGLRWDDVDFARARLTVRAARVAVDGAAVDSTPKTISGLRVLPLTPDLLSVLRRAQQRQADDERLAGRAYRRSGLVVVDQLGGPLHPETLSSRWEALLRTTGQRLIRLHDARHTCGTLLHLQGVPVAVIAAWLGHADPAFTMRTYLHSQDDALRDAARALGRRRDTGVTPEGPAA